MKEYMQLLGRVLNKRGMLLSSFLLLGIEVFWLDRNSQGHEMEAVATNYKKESGSLVIMEPLQSFPNFWKEKAKL